MALFDRFRRKRKSEEPTEPEAKSSYFYITGTRRFGDVCPEPHGWHHDFVMNGASLEDTHRFIKHMQEHLDRPEPFTRPRELVPFAEREQRRVFSNRGFHTANSTVSELHELWRDVSAMNDPKAYTEKLLLSGNLVEFGYKSERLQQGDPLGELHVRRMRITRVREEGFQAEHTRGRRNFRYSQVRWFSPPLPQQKLEEAPVVRIRLVPLSAKATEFIMELGTLGDNGKFSYI